MKKHWMIRILTVACSLIAAVCGRLQAEALILVEAGQARAIVVTADQPSPTAAYAAAELVWHIHRATGVRLEIIPESRLTDESVTRVFVGVCQAAREAGIDPEELGFDVALLRAVNNDLFMLGRENRQDPLIPTNNHAGTLFAVYDLLEDILQVRWLWPGELGTYVPAAETIKVPAEIDQTTEPAIPHRHIWGQVQFTRYRSAEQRAAYRRALSVYNRRHRLGHTQAAPSPAHSLRTWWAEYSEEHPDWFAMNEAGERVNTGMCVSNPDLHRYIVEGHEEHTEHSRVWRDDNWIVLGDRDSGWLPCQCDECLAWDGPIPDEPSFARGLYDRFGWFGTSDRYARFCQAVYEKAVEYNPGVKVAGYLYWSYFPAPTSDLEISPNVYGHYTPWGTAGIVFFPLPEEVLEWKKDQWRGWRETGISMIYRPNHWNASYPVPHLTWQGGEFFQWAYENGMVGFKFDKSREQWGIQGPMNYLYYRLFANPEQAIADVLEQYYSGFGPAAEYVKQYAEYWESYARERHRPVELPPGLMFGAGYKLARHIQPLDPAPLQNPAATADAYPMEKFPPAEAILKQAMVAARQASKSEYAERVEFLQKGLEHTRLIVQFWESLEIESATRAVIPDEPEARRAAVMAFAALEDFRHRHGNSYIANFGEALQREGRAVDIEKLRDLQEKLFTEEEN